MLADTTEGQAVDNTGPQLPDGLQMRGAAIALVCGKSVSRIVQIQFAHQAVAGNLGNDRGGGDRKAEGIPLFDGLLGDGGFNGADAVDQQEIGNGGKLRDRLQHGLPCGLQDIDPVDHLGPDDADADRRGLLHDQVEQAFPCLRGQLFGVVNLGQAQSLRQDDGSRYHRAGQGAAAGLVDTGNRPVSTALGLLFEGQDIKGGEANSSGCVIAGPLNAKGPAYAGPFGVIQLLRTGHVFLFADPGCLAAQLAQVVQLGAADMTAGDDFDGFDGG